MEIKTREVKKHNNTSGYIQMPKKDIGKEFVVMTLEELEFMVGRKLEVKDGKDN